jgi:carboxyl-terminal processing protease
MLPASNRGAGMNLGFPDVCNTVVGPATVPIPYPNVAMNAMAAPFSPIVKLSMMPALNVGSSIPMTSGDELGTAHPTVKGAGRYTMGNPIVFVDGLPGVNLGCPTTGNNMNDPLGAVLVPSATNVLFCDARASEEARVRAARGEQAAAAVTSHEVVGEVGWIALRALPPDAPARFHAAVAALEAGGARAFVLDLRGNGGGELDAAVRLAEELLDEGKTIAIAIDGDGDAAPIRARHRASCRWPLVVVIDGGTASAAEVLAAALGDARRATLVGLTTHGKGVATGVEIRLAGEEAGEPVLSRRAVLALHRAGGGAIHGVGVEPHVPVEAGGVVAAALDVARGLLSARRAETEGGGV